MIEDDRLYQLNQQGWIPGPEESEVQFFSRIEQHTSMIDCKEEGEAECWKLTASLFDFRAPWLPIEYSSRDLCFWQCAATWLSSPKEGQQHPNVLVQIHPRLRKEKKRALYTSAEVIAHESVHAVRMAFPVDPLEEHFAYSTSKLFYRRWIGPLFQRSWESGVGVFSLSCSLLAQALDPWVGEWMWLRGVTWFPLCVFGGAGIRLLRMHRMLALCRAKCRQFISCPKRVNYLLFRLTAKEISHFSRWDVTRIQKYIHQERDRTLRGRLLAMYAIPKITQN